MSQNPRVQALDGGGGDSLQKKLDKWGYTPGKGFASTASQQNSANNTTRENANDRLNNTRLDSGQAGAGGVNAKITAAQKGGESNNQNQSSSQRNPEQTTIATMNFSAVAKARKKDEDMNPIALFFPEKDWEKEEQEGRGRNKRGHGGQQDEDEEEQEQREYEQPEALTMEERLEANRRRVQRLKDIREDGLMASASGASNAVNVLKNRHGISSAHINEAARSLAMQGEGLDMLKNVGQANVHREVDPSKVKGTMAEGDSIDIGP